MERIHGGFRFRNEANMRAIAGAGNALIVRLADPEFGTVLALAVSDCAGGEIHHAFVAERLEHRIVERGSAGNVANANGNMMQHVRLL